MPNLHQTKNSPFDSAALGVIRENLAIVGKKTASADTVRRGYYRQAAEIFLGSEKAEYNYSPTYENQSLFHDSFNTPERSLPRESSTALDEFHEDNGRDATKSAETAVLYEQLLGECGSLITPDYAVFCLEFAKATRNANFSSRQSVEDDVAKIAYMQNTYSDKAYRILSPTGKTAAMYFPGFREACEEVYYERCSHTLLPVYSSSDGVLLSFYKLLLKYDLRIVRSCTVKTNDEGYMKYALAAKYTPENSEIQAENMDISVVLSESERYGDFISACEVFGASVITVNSITLNYTDDGCGILLQLDTSKADVEGLRLFLDSSRVRCSIIGQYDAVRAKKC